MKRAIAPFLVVPALALVAAAFLVGAERDLGAGYELENVEVLDPLMGLPEARLYMITFNEALGLQCRDCHDLRDFAADTNELKRVARDMMKMQLEINESWFPDRSNDVVTCWTCHHGQRIPPTDALSGSLLDTPAEDASDRD